MKYYLTKTDVTAGDPAKGEPFVVATEVVMTKPGSLAATQGARSRWTAMGIENLHVNKYGAKRYKMLLRAQNKKRKETKMTNADVAQIVREFAESDGTSECEDEKGNNG